METSIVEAPMSREDQETAALLQAQAAENREMADEKSRINQETATLLEAQSTEKREKSRERSYAPLGSGSVASSSEGEKCRLERETLAMLEGRSEKKYVASNQLTRQSRTPPVTQQAEMARDEGMDWDAPPPAYEQSFGDGQQKISTAVLGNSHFH